MKKILAIILIIVGLGFGYFVLPSMLSGTIGSIVDGINNGDEAAITEKISDVAEESVMEYNYTNAVKLKDARKMFKDIKIPLSEKEIVMIYDGKLKIGADVSKIKAEVDKGVTGEVKAVKVTLPEVKITSSEINRDTIKFSKESNGILNSIDNSDYDNLENKGKTEIEKTVKKSEVMNTAKLELEKTIKGYIKALYGNDVDVSFE